MLLLRRRTTRTTAADGFEETIDALAREGAARCPALSILVETACMFEGGKGGGKWIKRERKRLREGKRPWDLVLRSVGFLWATTSRKASRDLSRFFSLSLSSPFVFSLSLLKGAGSPNLSFDDGVLCFCRAPDRRRGASSSVSTGDVEQAPLRELRFDVFFFFVSVVFFDDDTDDTIDAAATFDPLDLFSLDFRQPACPFLLRE